MHPDLHVADEPEPFEYETHGSDHWLKNPSPE
jgi:hypothetical protein